MARLTVQQGHVPRTSGRTGTHREQELAREIGTRIAHAAAALGHTVALVGADDPLPPADLFLALHGDGSADRARRGASVGYPDGNGREYAWRWKEEHQRAGYDGGFLRDNYTTNLSRYYGFKCRAGIRVICEHGMMTNPSDESWLFANLDAVATAHVVTIGRLLGHPVPAAGGAPGPAAGGYKARVARHPELRRGSTLKGHVRVLQGMMNAHGAKPTGGVLRVDGDFGPATHEQLVGWARRTGVVRTDGVVDGNVWAYMVPDTLPVVRNRTVGFVAGFGQGLMVAHGAFAEEEIDGDFGPRSENALRSWQGRTGILHADGLLDAPDWDWLLGLRA
jgi:peptidoglycan hydrolase-like protein with peptidoglycan-binding domain